MPAPASRPRPIRPEKLKQLRKRLHIGQLELARKLGYSRSTVAHIENGTTPASTHFTDALERILGVTRAQLYSYGAALCLLAL
jgi:transcriptional regulator with XRE-family HTH domain